MKSLFRLLFPIPLLVLFFCSACTTAPDTEETDLPKSRSSYENLDHRKSYNDIDIASLVQELEMDQPVHEIGFTEKSFNSCDIKSNRSEKPICQRLYLGRVNFQVMCRDSTGTVEKVNLEPLDEGNLRWKQGRHRGYTRTNSMGYGSIEFISTRSSMNQALYLYLGRKVARKSLKDMWKLILPKNWCLD